MELHSTISSRLLVFLPHAARTTRSAMALDWRARDFMGPKIQNGLAKQQQNVVECVRPSSYAEASRQVQGAEKEARDRPKHEREDVPAIAERADVMKGREDQRAEDRGEDAGEQGAPAEQLAARPGERTHEHDAEQQLLVQPRADRQHQHRASAQPHLTQTDGFGWG